MGAVSCKKEVRINRICGGTEEGIVLLLLLLLSFSEEEHNIVKAFYILKAISKVGSYR
jgi:hypothetical protein